jgi:hypothetical protein
MVLTTCQRRANGANDVLTVPFLHIQKFSTKFSIVNANWLLLAPFRLHKQSARVVVYSHKLIPIIIELYIAIILYVAIILYAAIILYTAIILYAAIILYIVIILYIAIILYAKIITIMLMLIRPQLRYLVLASPSKT